MSTSIDDFSKLNRGAIRTYGWDVASGVVYLAGAWLVPALWARIIASAFIVGWIIMLESRRASSALIEHYRTWGVEPNSNGRMPSVASLLKAADDSGRVR